MTDLFKIIDNPKVKTSELLARCKAKFDVWCYWDDEALDKNFPPPKKETTRYFKKVVEPDTLDVSYNQAVEQKLEFMTIRERIIAELQYFEGTGGHLDIIGWTRTSSLGPDGSVASADWDVGDGRFRVFWSFRDSASPSGGFRLAVPLETSNSSPSIKTYTLQELQDFLPDFIDDEYPKGVSKERGLATVAITLYTLWLRKREINEK